MKRILFVVPDLEVGGVQRALVTLLNAAPLDRLDITLLTFREGGQTVCAVAQTSPCNGGAADWTN